MQGLRDDRAVLLQMEKDATQSRLLAAVLLCVGARTGDRNSIASLVRCAFMHTSIQGCVVWFKGSHTLWPLEGKRLSLLALHGKTT